MAIDRWKSELALLPTEDRAERAQFLLETPDNLDDSGVDAGWEAETLRRLEEMRSGKVIGKPADRVFAEMKAKRLPE